jgi:MYXO-CTERM domain-containing protein
MLRVMMAGAAEDRSARRVLPPPVAGALALALTACLARTALANDVPAASCAASDVSAAIGTAAEGDTVVVPACASSANATWASGAGVSIVDKGVTLQGAGIGATNVSISGDFGLVVSLKNGTHAVRVTGFSFALVGTAQHQASDIDADGHGTVRVDHCAFTMPTATGGFPLSVTSGHVLIDHNTFAGAGITVQNEGEEITKIRKRPIGWGQNFSDTVDWTFVEDNTFDIFCSGSASAVDMDFGAAKLVFRHNVAYNGAVVGHAACWTTLAETGHIASDIYENEFSTHDGCDYNESVTDIMGGTFLFHDNVVKNVGSGRYSVDTCPSPTTSCPHNIQDVRTKDAPTYPGVGQSHHCNGGTTMWQYCDAIPDKWCEGSDDEHWYTCDTDADCDAVPTNWGLPPMGKCAKMRCSNTWTLCMADTDCPAGETCSKYLDEQTSDGTLTRCFNGAGSGQLLDADGTIALEPMYGWNNSLATCDADGGACQTAKSVLLATGDVDPNAKLNRELYNEPKPGYCHFTYPHPLTGLPPVSGSPTPECGAEAPDGGAPSSGAGGASASSSSSSSSMGGAGGGHTSKPAAGCKCETSRAPSSRAWAFAILAGAAVAARRRRGLGRT